MTLDFLAGLRIAGRQEVDHVTMVALVRDQPLAVGAMVAGRQKEGPFFRPHGVIYRNDGPQTNPLETRLFMDPNRLGDEIVGMVPDHYAARARIHQLFMELYPFSPKPVPFKAPAGGGAQNPFKRGSTWYRDTSAQFEIADGQVGALYLVNERLVGVIVVPDPETYRQLHPLCLGEVLSHTWSEFAYHPTATPDRVAVKAHQAADLADLKQQLLQEESETNEVVALYTEPTLGTLLTAKGGVVDDCSGVAAERRLKACSFITAPQAMRRRFQGEMIRTHDGSLCYFRSMAIDAKLQKMAVLYETIDAACWQLPVLLKNTGWTNYTFYRRCREAGCIYLDKDKWLRA